MDNMRTKFVIAVTGRLAPAADSDAKIELIEELSENLYSRWTDLVGSGMEENAAFDKAMEDLGNVDELLAYLESLGPDGELPKQEACRDFTSSLLHGVEDIVRETVSQTKDAVDQAAEIVRNVADKLKEKYPDGFKGKVYVQFDGDDAPSAETKTEAADAGIAEEKSEPAGDSQDSKGWSFSVGYNKNRGGFFCEGSRATHKVEGSSVPAQDIKGLDVQIVNGDVTVHLSDDPDMDTISLAGDLEGLEIRTSDDGVLSVRQGNTAVSSFFFFRGLAAADLEVTMPKRFWDFVQISTVNGDVDIGMGLEVGQLSVKTASGDAEFRDADCQELIFHSASGDLYAKGVSSRTVVAETASGDVDLTGGFASVKIGTASGDVRLTGHSQEIRCSSASGDVEADLYEVPQQLNVNSKSGDCEITIPGGEGFTLQFSTVSGEVDSDFQLVGPVGKRSGEAIYLDGGGRTFHISSISGDIELRQQ